MQERHFEQLTKLYGALDALLYSNIIRTGIQELEGPEWEQEIVDSLLNQKKMINMVLLDELQSLSDKARGSSFELLAAQEDVRAFFRTRKAMLDNNGISLLFHGSVQYGDTETMGADILAVSQKDIGQARGELGHTLTRGDVSLLFIDHWKGKEFQGKPTSEPTIEHVAIDAFTNFKTLGRIKPQEFLWKTNSLGTLMSGSAVFPGDAAKISTLRAATKRTVESDPLLTALVNSNLKATLQERQTR